MSSIQPVTEMVYVPYRVGGEGASSLRSRTERAAGELADAVARRGATAAEDPFDPATYLGEGRSFESLLGGLTAD